MNLSGQKKLADSNFGLICQSSAAEMIGYDTPSVALDELKALRLAEQKSFIVRLLWMYRPPPLEYIRPEEAWPPSASTRYSGAGRGQTIAGRFFF